MIRVLIVDDSYTTREFLKQIIDADPRFQVAGEAKNGMEAMEKAASATPDVIIMDLQMPGMNGYEATQAIMETHPVPIIIHSTIVAPEQTENIFKAMKAGAVAVSQKPPGMGHPEFMPLAEKLLRTIQLMAEVKVIRRLKQKTRPSTVSAAARQLIRPSSSNRIIAIGASTGGPPVLQTLLSRLEPEFSIPMIIVQHIAEGFLEGMMEWLSHVTRQTLAIPNTGEPVKKHHVYFAPEDHYISITPARTFQVVKIDSREKFKRPISHLFSSVASVYKKNAIGVLLTGMGNDGASGLKEMKDQGAITLVQDAESAVVFGMPGEAVKLGAHLYQLSPSDITVFLNKAAREDRS
jgi:two-component system chemotaxis response regulator CheB